MTRLRAILGIWIRTDLSCQRTQGGCLVFSLTILSEEIAATILQAGCPLQWLAVSIPSRRSGSGQPSKDRVARSYFPRHQSPSILFSAKTGGDNKPLRGRAGFGAIGLPNFYNPTRTVRLCARAMLSSRPRLIRGREVRAADRHFPHQIDEIFDCIPRGLDRL